MEYITKPCACADISICPNSDNSGLIISAALPGVHKEDIRLNMTEDSLCLAGEREDLKYDCCYLLPCDVNAKKSDARFDSGLLTVTVPFKKASRGRSIAIH